MTSNAEIPFLHGSEVRWRGIEGHGTMEIGVHVYVLDRDGKPSFDGHMCGEALGDAGQVVVKDGEGMESVHPCDSLRFVGSARYMLASYGGPESTIHATHIAGCPVWASLRYGKDATFYITREDSSDWHLWVARGRTGNEYREIWEPYAFSTSSYSHAVAKVFAIIEMNEESY